jgi:flagellar biosynthesis GTPase FlhF
VQQENSVAGAGGEAFENLEGIAIVDTDIGKGRCLDRHHRADDAEQDPAEVRTTQALNDEIAARNALAANQERADREAFEADRAKHEAVVAQAIADRLAYEESVREAEAAQRRWEADVRACEAGDRTRCAGPQ